MSKPDYNIKSLLEDRLVAEKQVKFYKEVGYRELAATAQSMIDHIDKLIQLQEAHDDSNK